MIPSDDGVRTDGPISAEHLIAQSDALDAHMDTDPGIAGLRKLIDDTRVQQRRQDRLTRALGILAGVAIVIAGSSIYVSMRVDRNAQEIARATTFAEADANNLRIICEKGNVDNAKRRALWQFVLNALAASPNIDPGFVLSLTGLVDDAYAEADCDPAGTSTDTTSTILTP